jgi:glycine/D-amino acid oxidase-like deaminating enzyme/nitrite reductase/ring-hydroxylating ferredoxin subunit
MDQHSGITNTIWQDTAPPARRPKLDGNQTCDVCVVGAGTAGLMTAYELVREGRSVVIIDDGPICGGETERTTAHLANAMDDRFYHLEKLHGLEGSRLAAQSHGAAISRIETIAREENVDCDFGRLDGYLFQPPGTSPEQLRKEFEAAERAGMLVESIARAPLPSFDTGPALRFPNQGQFHPLKFLSAIAAIIEKRGGRIFCNTRAVTVEGGESAFVETESKLRVSAGAVVVATNTPMNDRYVIHTKQAPYRTYVVGLALPPGSVPPALYWDTAQDAEAARHDKSAWYHYVRLQAGENEGSDLLIVGGEDHKTGQATDADRRWASLEQWTRERFPMAGEVSYRWSGQVMETQDGLGFIGRNPDDKNNVYVCTGDSGQGMTHGAIAGMLLNDLIHGRENPWARLYDPSRIRFRAAGDFLSENLNVAAQYKDLVTGGDITALSELPLDTGAVVRSGIRKLAVYRDEQGQVHAFSAVCPHLKCIVQWNPGERSWDCPCHGSRFTRFGEVINGPAMVNLQPEQVPGAERKAA